jgi:hypothetical protein
VLNLKNLGGEGDIGLDIIRNGFPAGRFISTGVNYTGNDLTPIAEWLGADGASYRGLDGNLDDGIFSFSGLINITEPGEVSFRSESDDGSIVWIAGQKVVDNDGSHGSPGDNADGKAFFAKSGLYPIEVAYFNGDWTDDDGNHGGAGISLLSNGEVISGDVLYRADNTISLANADVGTGLTDEDPDNNDPAAPGSATISSPFTDVFDVDVVAGGGDIWGEADRGHFVYTDWTGDFDASVQVTKLDPINRWSKAGISIRESIAEDSRMMYVNVDADNVPTVGNPDDEGADRYEMGVRIETAGSTGDWAGNGGEAIVGDLEIEFPAWIRVTRIGNTFTAYRGDDGVNWAKMSSIEQDYPEAVVLALATTSHDNGGVDLVTSAEYRSFTIGPVPSGPVEPPMVDINFADGQVTVTWDRGNLQSAPSVNGEWTDVTFIPGRAQPAQSAQSPFTANVTQPTLFFRVVE